MHEKTIKTIKSATLIGTFILSVIMIIGILKLKNNFYFRWPYIKMQYDSEKEIVTFARFSGENFWGIASSVIFKNQKSNFQNDSSSTASVPVLVYHGIITDTKFQPDGVNTGLNDFRTQMFSLKQAGWQTITLADFQDFMQGKKKLPEKSFLLTFDDSRSDSFYPVEPILETLNYNAVMFVITGRSLGPDNAMGTFHLAQPELKGMLATGRWELESHTQNGHGMINVDANGTQGNFLSNLMWMPAQNRLETPEEFQARIQADLLGSKNDLEQKLGVRVLGFAYPFGDFGHNSQNFSQGMPMILKGVNSLFPLSFRQAGDSEYPANYPGVNFRLIKRLNVSSEIKPADLLLLLDSSQEKNLPYVDNFSSDSGWIAGWGTAKLTNGLLLTGSTSDEDSSLTFLNGTFSWQDYDLNANLSLIKGSSFSVVMRYIDGNNYASCDFSDSHVSLTERINGQEKIVAEYNRPVNIQSNKDINVGVSTKGNQAICSFSGQPLASGNLSSSLNNGGVAFKTWDNTINNSSLLVKNVKVQ